MGLVLIIVLHLWLVYEHRLLLCVCPVCQLAEELGGLFALHVKGGFEDLLPQHLQCLFLFSFHICQHVGVFASMRIT